MNLKKIQWQMKNYFKRRKSYFSLLIRGKQKKLIITDDI